jgi:hypothetical protein
MLIEVPDFALDDELRILALQGDWGVRNDVGAEGGRFLVDDPPRAHQACLEFLVRLRASTAHMALIPELAIPRQTIPHIIATIREFPRSVVFLGGIEGLTQQEYASILNGVGESQGLIPGGAAGYVNSLLILVKTPTRFVAHARAKRVASRAENLEGPPMALGDAPFAVLRLAATPLTVVPLICAEFVWPEHLWERLDDEVAWNIDVVPVLQRNEDLDGRHIGPQLHRAYTQGGKTAHTRFVFVNQAIGAGCDGTSYVVVPPTAPADPAFDHSSNELWHLPGVRTYRGFRIPDRTGCIWSAHVVSPQAAASALGNRFCAGGVTEVLTPAGAPLRGLSVGLMRSVAAVYRQRLMPHAGTAAYDPVIAALERQGMRYILREITSEAANDIFFRMYCAEWPRWGTVESVIGDCVEAAALLAAGGDNVVLTPCDGGNCSLAGKPVAVLYAPNVDVALTAKFPLARVFDASPIPAALVLIGVVAAPAAVGAHKVGDVLRADRVTSGSPDLAGMPPRTEESSVTIRIDDVEFRSLTELRPNLDQPGAAAARERIRTLFPKVYA